MDYFAGLDISMDETHVCVLDREGVVVRELGSTTPATACRSLFRAPSAHSSAPRSAPYAPGRFMSIGYGIA
jgi:transposase